MRSSWKTLVAFAAAVLVAPQLAAADDVQEQMRSMQERMGQLEDSLRATNDQLAEANRKVESQQQLIQESGLGDRAGGSALMNFASKVVFDGFVAASYNFNVNYPGARRVLVGLGLGTNEGALGNVAPHHPNANSFQVDQLWFGMEKAATAESRGGFRADIVFGASADDTGVLGVFGVDDLLSNGDYPHLYQAYAQYLAPIGSEGILIKAGRYETLLGAEKFRADANFNITRGILWSTLIPVNHEGVLVEGSCGDCGFDWALGIANSDLALNWDTDNAKTGLGRIRWTGETASLAIAGLYGGDVKPFVLNQWFADDPLDTWGGGRDADALPILDVVATWDPSENLSMWLEYTHLFDPIDNNVSQEYEMFGFAGAARLAITDRTGISTRLEFIRGDDVFEETFGNPINGSILGGDGSSDLDMWSVTGTIDHALTDNLIVKLEGRWDYANVKGADDDVFVTNCDINGPRTLYELGDQFLVLVQMMYKF